ncbi:uncharacterized protein ACLA_043090 [Aspergillus clavatus NRRL 1]|uniref:Uncharacterized protein n=1 Tax=Aspergillus clavatus (strain ATCC 1007 / CBS 513.65 / DSM 816 / NCTC 3887 / NRRL 1 / QM 1276 / 107) TaxID=344612 RepID=A1C8F4_ASPCL|nr:uncharacterized protein ACLA_043090 [Aspergillus clavatus NRRL 1]EAW13591.1 predicted protein [Aspergillus clavatus NRRL 1]
MSNILTTLGLRAASGQEQPPNYATVYLLANWFYAYVILSSRAVKRLRGIDHNAAPREDLNKYGDVAVQSGKMYRRALNHPTC